MRLFYRICWNSLANQGTQTKENPFSSHSQRSNKFNTRWRTPTQSVLSTPLSLLPKTSLLHARRRRLSAFRRHSSTSGNLVPAIVADIGCGSGCLTLLARQELGERVELYASDLLPEAVATTKLNFQRLLPDSDTVHVMPAGDLV